jgi:predicted nucleic acid-binding protein
VIVIDTSVLVDSLTGNKRLQPAVRKTISSGEQLNFPSLVLYEWLRGPRVPAEHAALRDLMTQESVISFGPEEARIAAELYRLVPRPRSREIDLGIAACAISREAPLWTLNPRDFADIPELKLYRLP